VAGKKPSSNKTYEGNTHQNTQLQGDGPVIQKLHDGFSEGIGADAPVER
jgi:hypothetical protein